LNVYEPDEMESVPIEGRVDGSIGPAQAAGTVANKAAALRAKVTVLPNRRIEESPVVSQSSRQVPPSTLPDGRYVACLARLATGI
jgi:hypothetical protein